jgi:hypothetical protein
MTNNTIGRTRTFVLAHYVLVPVLLFILLILIPYTCRGITCVQKFNSNVLTVIIEPIGRLISQVTGACSSAGPTSDVDAAEK